MDEHDDEARMDELLRRWCRRRDVDALGVLFDLAAQRLLRIAIHVIGDPAAAEDLVQATFLATIERREHIDAERPALQWLVGVLHHKAIDARRRRGRLGEGQALELDALASHVEDASARVEARELSAEVAASIDRLDAPYRHVLLLRLRHGASIAEVAHLLERSPATVRVQLHRGLERLRALLPPSLALAALGALGVRADEPGALRGLATIKAAVLAEASLAPLPLTLVGWIGVQVMGQKALLGGLALAALASLLIVRALDSRRPIEALPSRGDAPSEAALIAAPEPGASSAQLEATPIATVDRVTALEQTTLGGPARTGVVVDALTGAPLAGATVAAHQPLRGTLMGLLAARPELFRVQNDGVPKSRTWADWPMIVGLDSAGRFDAAEVEVYADIVAGRAPLATAVTDAAGRFTLAGSASAVLVASAEGYAPRARAALDNGTPCRIELRAARRFHGQVVRADGAPVGRALELAVFARLDRLATDRTEVALGAHDPVEGLRTPNAVSASTHALRVAELLEGVGTWRMNTDAEGRFEGWFGVDALQVASLDRRWVVRIGGTLTPDVEGHVVVQAQRSLHVFDAATGAPLEALRLVGRERANGYVRLSGAFHVPGGYFVPDDHGLGSNFTMPGGGAPSLTVWARGYAPALVNFDGADKDGTIDVPLSAGDWAGVEGIVHRGGVPAPGVEVALLGHSPLQWRSDEDTLFDGARTDEVGHFALGGAPGRALLRVLDADIRYFELVDLPVAAPLDIDLAQLAVVHARVVHPDGTAAGGHVVGLSGDDGRSERLYADASGQVEFTALSPGRYTVMAPFVTTTSSFGGDVTEVIELARGGDALVTLTVPDSTRPRHLSIVVAGTDAFVGWRARFGEQAWVDVEPSGRVPLDLNTDQWQLYVVAPDGRRWQVSLPRAAPDGYALELTPGPGRFEGVLLDAAGAPQVRVALQFTPQGPFEGQRPTSQCLTDDAGRFAIGGLALSAHRIQIRHDPDATSSTDGEGQLEKTAFQTETASPDGAWLELRVARARPDVRLAGRVRTADGLPVANGLVWYRTEARNDPANSGAPNGALTQEVAYGTGYQRLDEQGNFSVVVPRHERCVLRVFGAERGQKALLEHVVDLTGEAELPLLDLVAP